MAANSVPIQKLELTTEKTATGAVVHCSGRITSDTTRLLKTTVKPLFLESKTVVLDMMNVNYVDSSGLGTIFGLHVSANTANCQLQLTNLNKLLKDLFSMLLKGSPYKLFD